MIILAGCRVAETLREDNKTGVYRALRDDENGVAQSVIVKSLRATYPLLDDVARLRHEFQIARSLPFPGVVQPLALVKHNNGVALILEDFGGVSLYDFLKTRESKTGLDLDTFLRIALALTATLEQIHAQHVIHKDIKPDNVLYNPQTQQIKLGDFGIASQLASETPAAESPQRMQGTLAYMSPEQTGRMNQPVDYRTDFYSLGVTFYQMLTGRVPFEATDAMEIVHCHLAKNPLAPQEMRDSVPTPLSNIVLKLLAKTARERYQSASGLNADLEECHRQWEATGRIESFPLGRHDRSDELHISTRIYGREAEIATLLEAFERAGEGACEMVLVAGYSGIGKTSVVDEVHKPIVRRRGFFASGKFDQFRRDVPYSSLIQAFRQLIRQILTESEEDLARFKSQMLEAFGPNGQLLIEVIPEIELIVGPQPVVPTLGPQESLNRFNFLLSQFMRVWTQPEHPLVLFLDDLQWADAASLKFLQTLMSDGQTRHLLIVGAYRNNEVTPSHPMMLALDAIRKSGATPHEITLGPLSLGCINELLQDSLRCSPTEAEPLAALLLQRTEGNPFFLNQLLKSWHDQKLVFSKEGKWRWDLEAIAAANLIGNVVELMAGKIQILPTATQDILKLASCIGNRFDSRTLATVSGQSAAQIANDLWEALRSGLISPLSGSYQDLQLTDGESDSENVVTYKFLHDRVQQAAYSLLDEVERPALHAKIGRLMLQHSSEAEREDKIFEIVSHWNQARDLITGHEERHQLVLLNLQAGLKAKASAAHQAALSFYTVGQEVAPDSLWEEDYDSAFQLVRERSECEYIEGHFEKADKQFELALRHANTVLDRARIEKIRAELYVTGNDYERAIKVALEALGTLGLRLPAKPSQITVLRILISIKKRRRRRPIADLANLPVMRNERLLTQMPLMSVIAPASYLSGRQNLFLLTTLQIVNISLRYGNTDTTGPGYAGYGMMLGLAFGDYKSGYEFGEMAVRMSEQFGNNNARCRTLFVFGAYLMGWCRPWHENRATLEQCYHLGLESGNLIYAGYAVFHLVVTSFFCGSGLELVSAETEKYLSYLRIAQDPNQWVMVMLGRQVARNLQGLTNGRLSLDSDDYDEASVLAAIKNGEHSQTCECWYYLVKTRFYFVWGDYRNALEMALATERTQSGLVGTYFIPDHNLIYSLTMLALYPSASNLERKTFLKQLAKNQAQMKKWAKNCPHNFEHKFLLVNAEMARIKGEPEAAALYDDAIASAHEASYTQNEALANELAMAYYMAQNRSKLAQVYFKAARYLYTKWGAHEKVAALDEAYPQFVADSALLTESNSLDQHRTNNPTSDEKTSALDLATVVKAAQALSGEIDWRPLLQKLLRFALENAGATRGALILRHDDQFVVEAIGRASENEVDLPSLPLASLGEELPSSLIKYVARTRESVVLSNALQEGLFTSDPYILQHQSKSVLCAPIVHQTKLDGVIYLENDLALGAFTPTHLEVLGVLSAQAAISLQNAQLYSRLEDYSRTLKQRVEERTIALRGKNEQLEQTLRELQEMQNRVIVQEKMASLGALTAGIAHEIKNPLNFVNNFAALSVDLTGELAEELEKLTDLDDATREYLEEILGDLKSNAQKINEHGKRADSIVRNMLLHSRGQHSSPEATDVNALIHEAVQLAYHGQRAKDSSFNVAIEENFGATVGSIKLLPQEISRVVLNLVNNACYAAHQKTLRLKGTFSPTITVTTENCGETIEVRVGDNGDGIPEAAREKIFTPFFTTKPTGEGTGLGLSMSYDIVVQQHGGNLSVKSIEGEGTEFVVSLPKL